VPNGADDERVPLRRHIHVLAQRTFLQGRDGSIGTRQVPAMEMVFVCMGEKLPPGRPPGKRRGGQFGLALGDKRRSVCHLKSPI